jgi:hypothetical protein
MSGVVAEFPLSLLFGVGSSTITRRTELLDPEAPRKIMGVEGILSRSNNVDYLKNANDGTYDVWCKICRASLNSTGMSEQDFEPHARAFVLEHDKCSPGLVPSQPLF